LLRIENGALGLIPYLMAGHPDRDRSVEAARSLVALPIAALELGMTYQLTERVLNGTVGEPSTTC